jgi:hypothetical protein
MLRSKVWVFVAAALLFGTGCTKSMTPGKMQWVRTDSDRPHAGNAYLLRGWIGVFSEGMDQLTQKINTAGVRANVYQDDQWASLARKLREEYRKDPNHEPLVLIGHSYGADDSIRIARELRKDGIPVRLLVTLDAVTPPPVPDNVRRCLNIYQSNGFWDNFPWMRGVPVQVESRTATKLANYDVRVDRTDLLDQDTNHVNIEKKSKIHAEIVGHVLAACPSRAQWVSAHPRVIRASAVQGGSAAAGTMSASGQAREPSGVRDARGSHGTKVKPGTHSSSSRSMTVTDRVASPTTPSAVIAHENNNAARRASFGD